VRRVHPTAQLQNWPHDSHHIFSRVGPNIRSARKHLGLTQPQLALTAGVGVCFVVELEAGKPTMRLDSAMRVIASLGGVIQLEGMPTADHEGARDAK